MTRGISEAVIVSGRKEAKLYICLKITHKVPKVQGDSVARGRKLMSIKEKLCY